jgi:hypothetical protein
MKTPASLFIILLILSVGCSSNDEKNPYASVDLLVINEGNFLSGDGTLTTFDRRTAEVVQSAYQNQNGFPLAATLQNAYQFEDKLFVTTNSPSKLEIIDPSTLKAIAVIDEGLTNPYGFAAIDQTGVVTNWGDLNAETYIYEDPFLAIIDLNDYTIKSISKVDQQPQHAIAMNDKYYVSFVGNYLDQGSTIGIYNLINEELSLVESIEVDLSPDRMVVDQNNNIWVIHNSGVLTLIDTETDQVMRTIEGIVVNGFNEKMVMNHQGDQLMYLASTFDPPSTVIYQLTIDATTNPETPFITGTNFYGLGIDEEGMIYVTNHNGFQGNGSVLIYDQNGTFAGDFSAGRGPNAVLQVQ